MKASAGPFFLIVSRALLGPAMLALATRRPPAIVFALILAYGLLSDIFDGIWARRLGVSTALQRRWDSQADMVFWVCAAFSSVIAHPELLEPTRIKALVLIALEIGTYAVSFARFGKEPCTHAYLAKFWGITLLPAMVSLLVFASAGFFVTLAFWMGVIADSDVILILLILPRWTHDIPSSYHAWLIRQGRTFRRHRFFHTEES